MIIYSILSQTQAEFKRLDEKFGFLSVFGCFSKAGKAVLGQEFNLVCAKPRLRRADSRFAEPRISLRGNAFLSYFLRCQKVGSCRGAAKDLILFVRMCYLCALIRGLRNLDASQKRDVFTFFLRRAKSNQKHAGRSPATHDSKLCRNLLCRKFRRHVSKPVLPTKRRRKGFESVRKDYRSADARLMLFRKRIVVLQAHSKLSQMKCVTAR